MENTQKPSMLVVSAHAADFVWRAAGSVALYAERGYRVKVVCLSYGERGESAKMWKQPAMTLDKVKAARREEAEKAARILGAEIEFFDISDYPMRVSDEVLYKLVDVFRELRPEFVLSHSLHDPYNFDHPLATHVTQEARIIAQAHGHNPEQAVIGAPPVFLFEPHQPEQCNWKPDVLLDISSVWEKKKAAFETMNAQEHLWEYYTRVALQRGVQASRNSSRSIRYGEAYQRVFPQVSGEFS
ncbi:PIG-L deacetylase family protein [Herbaspirillum autotrophicum]|uniref:PIG-L deacetylase family protein n=1 Tax=Herbaspirillum autotrophicum TaxID=180195 RepID=UPI00067B921D|nr:PIG-L deacetylase family protein [Herbaspirillum autotrophicum]